MKNKKLFAILTLVCFMFTLMPVAAMAEGEDYVAYNETGAYFTSLTDALKTTTGSEITLLKDITISDDWDCRYNGAKISKPITINGQEKTIKLTGKVDDKNWNTVFRFEDTATVKNLIIDVSEATGVQRGISAKMSITVENCKFIGNDTAKRAIIFGEGAGTAINEVTATITNCEFNNWSYGVSDNQSGKDAKSVVITGSTFENASALVSASETVTFSENELDNGYVNISSYTVPNELSVTATENTLDSDYAEYNTIKASSINAQEDFTIKAVAKVGDKYYSDLQEAIKAAAPSGTVEILKDVIVDEWIMMSQTKTIGNGKIIKIEMNGLTIDGNGHSLTVNSVESAQNGGYLFDDAAELNIIDLTINMPNGAGGIDLKSGTIDGVIFNNGNCIFPDDGDITITNCKFNTAGYVIYYETARDNLTVSNNTFNVDSGSNIILLYGNETFTGNKINSGRTVNVVSGSPTVTGNTFADGVRLKVYNDAEATIKDNTITVLAFNDEVEVKSTFANNILSDDAKAALKAAGCAFTVTYTDGVESEEIFTDQTTTVEKDSATPAFDGTPTRDGYTFAGWEPAVAEKVTTDSVYTATWTKNSTSYYYGGGTSASVSIASDDNATVKVSDKYADKGETVTITVDAKDGFYAKDVVVTDKNGEAITVTRVALDKWEFTMPSGKVKVDVDTAEYSKEVVLQIGDLDIAVNDAVIQSDVAPFIKNDRTMVPISVIVYALGGTTDWDGETRTVTVTLDGKVLTMVIDEIIPGFGAAAIIVDSRTYVPIGYVADVLGCDVDWIAATRQVVIVK